MFVSFFRVVALSALIGVASAATCAVCPSSFTSGSTTLYLTSSSSGSVTFCGYDETDNTTGVFTVDCLYDSHGNSATGSSFICPSSVSTTSC
ncbi:hypothetical protein NEOLEDRAFT_1129600 [Neolentinus lepideus HHB14362 ss-1]|uniref:Uncharacterized protein n=1 Tax=Neolentinus lepideus HHB14362 ss-1 TaxID=1314782 RepID=A0A165UJ99_9AGAM|nr:hypothetical protein NEOLEDRAFT_1129600 [Neolentinus lepideus HHB14362 ss-1]